SPSSWANRLGLVVAPESTPQAAISSTSATEPVSTNSLMRDLLAILESKRRRGQYSHQGRRDRASPIPGAQPPGGATDPAVAPVRSCATASTALIFTAPPGAYRPAPKPARTSAAAPKR